MSNAHCEKHGRSYFGFCYPCYAEQLESLWRAAEAENNKLKTELIQKECATQLRRFRAEKENARLRKALEWIATTNACDYEYVQHASAALAGKETT